MRHSNKVYKEIAALIVAIKNCQKSDNTEWEDRHTKRLRQIQKELLPSGSGFDSGCTIDLDKSTDQRIVIDCPFHEMNETGYYTGWRELRAEVTASLQFDFLVSIKGRMKDKEYVLQTMVAALDAPYTESR